MMIHLGRIVAADLVEYNPERDIDNITAEVASKLLKEIAGKMLISNNVVDR
jgi:arginase family enzyme